MEMLLTVEQAAERLQIKPATVREQLKAGRLRGIKRGRLWRIPESALLEPSTPTNSQTQKREKLALLQLMASQAAAWRGDGPAVDLSDPGAAYGYDEREALHR